MGKQRPGFIQFTDLNLKVALDKFCARTNRESAPTLRAIVRLFFAEGFKVASRRLNDGLWNVGAEPEQPSRVTGVVDEAVERAAAKKRKRKRGAG